MNHRLFRGGALAAAIVAAGCASAPVPDAQLAISRNAIGDAITAGAAESSPLELQRARDKMAAAEKATADKDYAQARRLAEEAEVDARLAAARTRSARANLAALEIRKGIQILRENLNGGGSDNPPLPR